MKKRIFLSLTLLLVFLLLFSCNQSDKTDKLDKTEDTAKSSNECSHEFSDWRTVIEPTCAELGKRERICSLCSFTDVEYLAPTPHKLTVTETVMPSCETEGYSVFSCSCGFSYKGSFVAPTGHKLTKELITPSGCSDPAYTHYACENCDFSYDSDFSERKHSFNTKVILPLATKNGYTEHICKDCGYSYVSDVTKYSDICPSPYGSSAEPLHKGLDLSNYDHETDNEGNYLPIDFVSLKNQGYDFVILKIGSSHSGKSEVFEDDYARAKAAGLEVGVYFYTYSSTPYGNANDAKDVIKWLEGKQLEYPVYYDLEDKYIGDLEKEEYTENITSFIETLQSNGYYGALYVNKDWLINKLDTKDVLSKFDIWFAMHTTDAEPKWSDYYETAPYSMWQASREHTVEGLPSYDGFVDLNFCYKDYSEIMKKWGLNGFERENSEATP